MAQPKNKKAVLHGRYYQQRLDYPGEGGPLIQRVVSLQRTVIQRTVPYDLGGSNWRAVL